MSDDTIPPASSSLAPAGEIRVLLSTAPPGEAGRLAKALVEESLAACVNVVPGLRSVYRWQGAVADEPETLLVIKTTADRTAALAGRLGQLHPYEVPELLALPVAEGLTNYLTWVGEQVADG